jgi:glycosyltransferase involved in cell wall biosynthesis
MNAIEVSFIITVYNKAHYIPRMIQGLRQQEGDFSKEYIFIDDGSSDNSLELIHSLTEGWENVHILTQPNQGPCVALNKGIRLAQGHYLKFTDGDDILVKNSTLKMIKALEFYKTSIVFGRLKISNDSRLHQTYKISEQSRKVLISNPLEALLKGKYHQINSIGATPSMVTRQAALHVQGADERVWLQDFSFALRLYTHYQAVYLEDIVCFCPEESINRLSTNTVKEGFQTLLTLSYFLKESPTFPSKIYAYTVWRASKRAYKAGKNILSFKQLLFYKMLRKGGWIFYGERTKCLSLLDKMIQELKNHIPM